MNEQEFWAALAPVELSKPSYRLYYDDLGRPIKYTVDVEPGNYIEVTVEQYLASAYNVKVVDGQLVKLKAPEVPMLVVSEHGVPTYPDDITVITNGDNSIKWSLKIYEED